MTDSNGMRLEVGHPAPYRDRVGITPLVFVLLGAPALWLVEFLVGFGFSSYLCFTGSAQGIEPGRPPWLPAVLYAVNLLGLATSLTVIALSVMLIRRTTGERHDQPLGVVDAGEGRTHFLAVWGLFIGVLFFVAIGLNTMGIFLVPICRA